MSAVLRRTGISFLYAPKLHPAMKVVAGVRRELGIRTIFNLLGPLTNPAFATRQVLGVYAGHLVEMLGRVLLALGAEHALVVHSRDGLDEISVSAPTFVCEVRDGDVRSFVITPEDLGLAVHSLEEVRGGDAAQNAGIIHRVFDGARGAARDIVIANAGAALYVAGEAPDIRRGAELAASAIASGAAHRKLQELVDVSREYVAPASAGQGGS
jgi:anthranilate phosphoribosyltransferase